MWSLRYRKLCSVICMMTLLMTGFQWQAPRAEAVLPVVAGAVFLGAAEAGAVAVATQAGLRFATGMAARKAAQIWGSRVAVASSVTVQRIATSPDVPGWVRYGLLGVLGVEGVQTALSIHDTVRASGTTGYEINQRVDSKALPYHIQQISKTTPLVAFGNTFEWRASGSYYLFFINGVHQGHGFHESEFEVLDASANGNVHRIDVAMHDETTVFFQYVFNAVDGNTWYGDHGTITYGTLTDVVPGGTVVPTTTWDAELLERLLDALQPQPRQVPNVPDSVFEINMPDIEALITQLGTLEAALAEAINMMVAEPQKTIVTEFLGEPRVDPPSPVYEGDFAGVISAILGLPGALAGFFGNVVSAIQALPGALAGFFGNVVSAIQALPGALAGYFASIVSAVQALPTTLAANFTGIKDAVFGLPAALSGFFASIVTAVQALPVAIATAVAVPFTATVPFQVRAESLKNQYEQKMIGVSTLGWKDGFVESLGPPVWMIALPDWAGSGECVLIDWADYDSLISKIRGWCGAIMVCLTGVWTIRSFKPQSTID